MAMTLDAHNHREGVNTLKKILSLVAFATASLLAACGGGGSSPLTPPSPSPTNPPVPYTSKLVFTGQLAGRTIQSDLRRAMDASGTATPVPIMVVSPISNGCLGFDCVATGNGTVQAVVSPEPSSAPTTTFSDTAPHVVMSPAALSSPGPGVIAQADVSNDGTNNVQSSGTASATIGSPVNQTPTTQVYEYRALAAECVPGTYSNGYGPGYAWNGASWVVVSDPSQADIYVTGNGCSGNYNVAGDPGTLNFPGGGTFVSTDAAFSSLAASQWANTETSVLGSTLSTQNADGSTNSVLIAKTRGLNGVPVATFKMFPNMLGSDNGGFNYIGAVEVSGVGVDGF